MSTTAVNTASNEALPTSQGIIIDLPALTPDAKHRAVNRPTTATPAPHDGHLPEPRLRPECLAVLGGMLNIFDRLCADGWPLQRAVGQPVCASSERAHERLPKLVAVGDGFFCCTACDGVWSTMLGRGGRMPRNYRRCPHCECLHAPK